MSVTSFLDPTLSGRPPVPGPRRRLLLGLLIAGVSGGLGVGSYRKLALHGYVMPRPGARRYPPSSRHPAVTPSP